MQDLHQKGQIKLVMFRKALAALTYCIINELNVFVLFKMYHQRAHQCFFFSRKNELNVFDL